MVQFTEWYWPEGLFKNILLILTETDTDIV